MLNRIPRIRAIYNLPKHAKHREIIEAAMQAQQPIIDSIITNGMHGHPEDKRSLRNCIALFEKVRKLSKLPIKPEWNFVEFAYLIAVEFDAIPKAAKLSYGIPEPYANPSTGANALFSMNSPSTLNMGRLVKRARSEMGFIPLLSALNDMKVSIINVERLLAIHDINGPERKRQIREATKKERAELAKYGITDVEIDDAAISYVLTKTRIEIPDFDNYVEKKGTYVDYLVAAMAKRLSFGFSPRILEIHNADSSQIV